MVFIFSFRSEVKPRCCLAQHPRPRELTTAPSFSQTPNSVPSLPVRKSSHTSAELASDSEHLPYTLVPYAHVTLPRKRDAKKRLQNTHVAAEKLREMH